MKLVNNCESIFHDEQLPKQDQNWTATTRTLSNKGQPRGEIIVNQSQLCESAFVVVPKGVSIPTQQGI